MESRKSNRMCYRMTGNCNIDYANLKVTYWKCELCARHGKKKGCAKSVLFRRRSTIDNHLRTAHQNMSIQEYEETMRNPRNLGGNSIDF